MSGRTPRALPAQWTALLSAAVVLTVGLPFVLRRHPAPERAPERPAAVATAARPTVVPSQLLELGAEATTAEVQSFDQFWRALSSVHERAAELGRSAFEQETLRLTIEYLELEDQDAIRFRQATSHALEKLDEARSDMQRSQADASRAADPAATQPAWRDWQSEQQMAADLVLGALHETPRHGLFAEQALPWLLRLEYGLQMAS